MQPVKEITGFTYCGDMYKTKMQALWQRLRVFTSQTEPTEPKAHDPVPHLMDLMSATKAVLKEYSEQGHMLAYAYIKEHTND